MPLFRVNDMHELSADRTAIGPLALTVRPPVPDLDLTFHELSDADLDTTFQVGTAYFGRAEATLADIREAL